MGICDALPFGGTCALRGCDPKKALVAAEETADLFRRMKDAGAVSGDVKVDWAGLMRFKRTFTEPVPQNREESYIKNGIAVFHGTARFSAQDQMRIAQEEITAANFVIATGAEPATLGFAGEEHLLTSTDFLSLETLPPHVAFVGGGYISFEFAQLCARAGIKATIVHRDKRPLEKFESSLVERLVEATRGLGVEVMLETPVLSVERSGSGFVLDASGRKLHADLVVHGAGRSPAVTDLDIERGTVDASKVGITVNEFLQSTTNPRVYAAGDAANTSGPPLTPVADYTGSIVAHNIVNGNSKTASFSGIPSIVFTSPSLGSVGMTQEFADKHGIKYRLNEGDSSQWYSNRRVNAKTAAYKILLEEGSQRVLGAHVMGPGTEELVNLFAFAMQFGVSATQLQGAMLAYPTYGSDISYMV